MPPREDEEHSEAECVSATRIFTSDGRHWVSSMCLVRSPTLRRMFEEVFLVAGESLIPICVRAPGIAVPAPLGPWDPAAVLREESLEDLSVLPDPAWPNTVSEIIPPPEGIFFASS